MLMDLRSLEKALDLENCDADILEETTETVRAGVENAIASLEEPRARKERMVESLRTYRYVGDLDGLPYGSYVRWVRIDKEARLTNGGYIIEVKIEDDGPIIVCKQQLGRIFQFPFNRALVFRKLSDQEIIILRALDYAANE